MHECEFMSVYDVFMMNDHEMICAHDDMTHDACMMMVDHEL